MGNNDFTKDQIDSQSNGKNTKNNIIESIPIRLQGFLVLHICDIIVIQNLNHVYKLFFLISGLNHYNKLLNKDERYFKIPDFCTFYNTMFLVLLRVIF